MNAVAPIPARSRYPAPDPARIAAAVKDGPAARDLSLHSPIALNDAANTNSGEIVRTLFSTAETPDPWVCVGKDPAEFATRRLSAWLKADRLEEFALIVPSAMTARAGKTKDGRQSEHTLENTGSRRYVVVEFDRGTADDHAARLWHLAGFAPLALVVHSGGKSLHGWFPVGDTPPENVERFMRYSAVIGADPALFRNRSQFVRLPGGTRDDGRRQAVVWWNPAALAVNGREAA